MEVVYFCYCGRSHIKGVWTEATSALWQHVHGLMENRQVELRIIPTGCDQCKDLSKPPKISLGGIHST